MASSDIENFGADYEEIFLGYTIRIEDDRCNDYGSDAIRPDENFSWSVCLDYNLLKTGMEFNPKACLAEARKAALEFKIIKDASKKNFAFNDCGM